MPHPLHRPPQGTLPRSVLAAGQDDAPLGFDQIDADAVAAQFDRLLDTVADKLPAVADHLEAARADVLAFTGFPKEV